MRATGGHFAVIFRQRPRLVLHCNKSYMFAVYDVVCASIFFRRYNMLTTIRLAGCLLGLNLIVVPAMAAGPRDAALTQCNAAAISRWSYHGTVYDKEDNRYAVYRSCMASHGQPQ
jgi:hypothetical protein